MAKGVLAELQRAAARAQREAERQQRQAQREYAARVRAAQQAAAAEKRATQAAERATQARQRELDRERAAAHAAARTAEAEARTARLDAIYDDIDTLLATTLDVDDHVDLESLRRTVNRAPFDQPHLTTPTPRPPVIPDPAPPLRAAPSAPTGVFGRKRKLEAARVKAEQQYQHAYQAWQQQVANLPAQREAAQRAWQEAEARRAAELERARAEHDARWAAVEEEVAAHNAELDALIAGLGYGTPEAVEKYVSIVLANSVYPEHFPVEHEYRFDPATAELQLHCAIIPPSAFPTTKAWRWVKKDDKLKATDHSQKAARERYAGAAAQVALRTLHEVFEADRRGIIRTIALQVGTATTHPATGKPTYICFVAVAAERSMFMEFDLSAVVAEATLEHLGASVSSNPWALKEADTSGVRRA